MDVDVWLQSEPEISEGHVKIAARQLFSALDHLHKKVSFRFFGKPFSLWPVS